MKKIILLLFICSLVHAQSERTLSIDPTKEFPQEHIRLDYNDDLLVTGETLYYKVYCLDETKKFSTYSKVAYLELVASDHKTILQQKIHLKSGIGYGDFFIDTSIKTGTYKLICYTNWMKNYENYFENTIFIVNPFSNDHYSKGSLKKASKTNDKYNNSITDKSSYYKREKVVIDIKQLHLSSESNISISVKRKNNFTLPLNNHKTTFQHKQLSKNIRFLPELRGHILHGKISAKNVNQLANKSISLSINNNHLPLMATTNHLGEFYFNIPYLNENTLYIQVLSSNASKYTIELLNTDKLVDKPYNFPPIQLTEEIVNSIQDRSKYAQIKNAYYSVKKDAITPLNNEELLFKNKTVYELNDYTRFKTLKETFTEIIDKAKIRNINDKYQIIVPSEGIKTTGFIGNIPSLLIVDGHIVNNHHNFIDFECSKIKTIAIVNRKYSYGNSIYQGITFVETFKKNYTPISNSVKQFSVLPMQPEKKYFFENYNMKSQKRTPDYRTQLYWDPNVDITKKEIVFYTSDITGEFEIEIEGFTKNGAPIFIKNGFMVRK